MNTPRLALCASIVAVVAMSGQGGAAPSGGTLSVRASFHDPGAPGFSNERPVCGSSEPGVCAFEFDGRTEERGGLRGATTYHGWLYGGDDATRTLRWRVVEHFRGAVAGCGRGSFVWRGSGYGDATTFDAATQSARLWGTVHIVPTSGTGQLAGVTGTLTIEARARAIPPGAQDGTMRGSLECPRTGTTPE